MSAKPVTNSGMPTSIEAHSPELGEDLLKQFMLLFGLGQKQIALGLLEDYLSHHPAKTASALFFVASLLSQNVQYEEAVPLYLEALRLEQNNPLIHLQLGIAYHQLNSKEESYLVWDVLAARFPEHPAVDFQYALRLMDDQKFTEALASLDSAAQRADQHSPLYKNIRSAREIVALMVEGVNTPQ